MKHLKHFPTILFVLLLWTGTLSATVYTPATVPDPKTAGQNFYVVNPDNIIGAEDVEALNAICTDLDQRCRVELAILCLDSIDERYDMFQFGYELFQAWGIGKAGQNNGVLLTLCRSRHEVRFNTGSGMEIYLTDAECSRIINEYMIPLFREDDYAGGLVMGAMRIEEICSNDEIAEELLSLRSVTNRGGYERGGRNDIYRDEDEDEEPWYIYTTKLIGFTLAIVVLTFLVLLPVFYQGEKQSIKKEIKQRRGWCIAWAIIAFFIMAIIGWFDYTPAIVLGVVPVFMYMRSFVRCEKCGKFGRHRHSSVITQSPTYESTGEEAYTYTCCNCGHTHHYTVILPKLTKSSGGGSGSGYSSGGGGGSWGGGSTSGGGAGGRW